MAMAMLVVLMAAMAEGYLVVKMVPTRIFNFTAETGQPWTVNSVNTQCYVDPFNPVYQHNITFTTVNSTLPGVSLRSLICENFVMQNDSDYDVPVLWDPNSTLIGAGIQHVRRSNSNAAATVIRFHLLPGFVQSSDFKTFHGGWPKEYAMENSGGPFELGTLPVAMWIDNLKNNTLQLGLQVAYDPDYPGTGEIACVQVKFYFENPILEALAATTSSVATTEVITETVIGTTEIVSTAMALAGMGGGSDNSSSPSFSSTSAGLASIVGVCLIVVVFQGILLCVSWHKSRKRPSIENHAGYNNSELGQSSHIYQQFNIVNQGSASQQFASSLPQQKLYENVEDGLGNPAQNENYEQIDDHLSSAHEANYENIDDSLQ